MPNPILRQSTPPNLFLHSHSIIDKITTAICHRHRHRSPIFPPSFPSPSTRTPNTNYISVTMAITKPPHYHTQNQYPSALQSLKLNKPHNPISFSSLLPHLHDPDQAHTNTGLNATRLKNIQNLATAATQPTIAAEIQQQREESITKGLKFAILRALDVC